MSSSWSKSVLLGCLGLVATACDTADTEFGPSLDEVRRVALMVPGDLPESIGAIVLSRFERSAASIAEGAPDEMIPAIRVAFQVRYPDSWIMVDTGFGPEFDPEGLVPSPELYAHLQNALRGARMIVFTHEHLDHVGAAVRSPYLAELEQTIVFNRAQARSLVNEQPESLIRLDSAVAARFVAVDYDPLMPVAPGVVLIKAPGHTPGSQMIYVHLVDGRELIFAGDISNIWSAVMASQQKPPRPDLFEDRDAIALQMAWLRDVAALGPRIFLAHDGAAFDALLGEGLVQPDVDLAVSVPGDDQLEPTR